MSSCSTETRMGGATGFTEGACPTTAEEAQQAMQPPVLDEEPQGCCFSIGFGDGMQPCCLQTTASVGMSACSTETRMGGATGFTEGACPTTAEEAQQAMQPPVLEEEPQGCCFSIGFGDRMQPCCLQ